VPDPAYPHPDTRWACGSWPRNWATCPGERPVLKLMYAAVIRAADRWCGLTVAEFEQRPVEGDS